MTRPRRTLLLLLGGSAGLVVLGALVLLYTVPSFKTAAKAKWHRWSCPDVPAMRTAIELVPSGTHAYTDPSPFSDTPAWTTPNLLFGFDPPVPPTDSGAGDVFSGTGSLLCEGGGCPAILRIVRDVADTLVSVSAGFQMKSSATAPDVRIIIRIDRPDGSLVDWNMKRLRPDEHAPDKWERFNFEWLLRDLNVNPEDRVAIFITSDDELLIDELRVVFRSSRPFPPPPHRA